MNCQDTPDLIHPYIDGELAAGPAEAVAAHLDTCSECTQLTADVRALRQAVGRAVPRHAAPAGLRSRLTAALAAEAAASAPARPAPVAARSVVAPPWRPWALAASLALAVVTSSGLTAYFTLPSGDDRLVDDIISGHVRSLMANHLTDVVSSDQHTVKPWFNGRIDLSPPVDDLAADGFALLGGRIDYLEQHPVAALVYRHRQHPINLFVLPVDATPKSGANSYSERGYNVLHWTHGDMSLWAASDLNLTELREFKRLYEKSSAPPSS